MASNNLNEGVGKKIVEALRMQTQEPQVESEEVIENKIEEKETSLPEPNVSVEEPEVLPEVPTEISEPELLAPEENLKSEDEVSPAVNPITKTAEPSHDFEPEKRPVSQLQMKIQSQLQFQAATQAKPQSFIDSAFNQSLAQNIGTSINISEEFDLPANVAVLRQLINRLPAGVSKQTGALIIKQTMEALGISMGGVLQEAKQIQESFMNSSKECQNNIVEYRKQIGILETKAQQFQRQANVMNDIINLFIQTSR